MNLIATNNDNGLSKIMIIDVGSTSQSLFSSIQAEIDAMKYIQEFVCKFCGSPSDVDPSDQSAPPDYCHESNHKPQNG